MTRIRWILALFVALGSLAAFLLFLPSWDLPLDDPAGLGGLRGNPIEEGSISGRPVEGARTNLAERVSEPLVKSQETQLAWVSCLDIAEEEAARKCLREKLPAFVFPEELADWICGEDLDTRKSAILISEVLANWPPEQALSLLDRFQVSCPRFRETYLLDGCVRFLQDRDPDWFSRFRRTFLPQEIFHPKRGQVAVQLATFLARQGDSEIREYLESGARGAWGGTFDQIDRAIGCAYGTQEDNQARFLFLESVLDSPTLPAEEEMGSTFAGLLMDPRCWPEADARLPVARLRFLLDDPRFMENAALTLVLDYDSSPPPGVDPEAWRALWARATQLAPLPQ